MAKTKKETVEKTASDSKDNTSTLAVANQQAQLTAENLIAKAIDKEVPVETMEKLLAMRRELKAEWAKGRFDEAMAHFQASCPVIDKTKKVKFKSKRTGTVTQYSYAPLDEIVRQIKDTISKYGFSYTIQTKNNDTHIISTVKVRHVDGHEEETNFEVPIDKDAFMNSQQQYASASTFSKRYAFCNAFGILTGDEDDDSNSIDIEEPRSTKTKIAKSGKSGKCKYCNTTNQYHAPSCPNNTNSSGSTKTAKSNGNASEKQIKAIFAIAKQLEVEDIKDNVKDRFGLDSFNDLTKDQASTVIDELQQMAV